MKKITTFMFALTCLLGYGQETPANSTNNVYQVPQGLTNFADIGNYTLEPISQQNSRSETLQVTVNSQTRGGAVDMYTDFAAFQAACTGALTMEDFSGGPGVITDCGPIISSAGDPVCYPAGELEEGFEATSTIVGGGGTVGVLPPASIPGNTVNRTGSFSFADISVYTFTGPDPVYAVSHTLYNFGDPDTEYRVYDTGGSLMASFTLNNPIQTEFYFGIISVNDPIGHIEIQGANDSGELVGDFQYGDCNSGGGGGCATVGSCDLIASTPDDATSPDIWDRPFAGGTCCSTLGPVSYHVYGPFTVDTDGAYDVLSVQNGWDGYLFVYQDCFDPLDQLNGFVAGDDDGAGGIGTSDIIGANLVTGTDYYVITTGFGAGDFGDFETTITGPGNVTCGTAPVDNDTCEDATAVVCGDSLTGDTSDNTDTGGNAAPDEWFSYTGSGDVEEVTISLCGGGTAYDSLIRVFDDCSQANEIAGNDDSCGLQSEVSFLSDGVSTYYIMIEGFGTASGAFSLDVSCVVVEIPSNDTCDNAIAIGCGETLTGTTDYASIDTDVAPDCDTGVTSPGVWYLFEDNSGLLSDITISLCDGGTAYDSKLSVYTGDCAAPPLTCVVGNDDSCGLQSEVSFQSDGATTYYVLVHGFGGATGDFSINVSCVPIPPQNDDIVNSIDVDELGCPFTDTAVATPAATLEGGNPVGCDISGANGVWYNITPDADGEITATISNPAGLSFVTFYTAADENASEGDLTLVDWWDNQCVPGTTTTIPVVAGQAYYIFVVNTGAVTDVEIECEFLGVFDNEIAGFDYYPNPASSTINLNALETIEHVALYNVLGQKALDQTLDATSTALDVSSLATGTYLMRVTVNGEIGTYKVIIE